MQWRFYLKGFFICFLVLGFMSCTTKKEPEVAAPEGKVEQKSVAKTPKTTPSAKTSPMASSHLKVSVGQMATAIEDLTPQGVSGKFDSNVGRIYCLTKAEGAQEETMIHHVWLHNEKEVARVELRVKSSPFRTYSSKIIESQKTGAWKVRVEDAKGNQITEIPFEVVSAN